MRVPQLYRKPGWQRFFAGMMCGAVISWVIFLFTYGTFQEEQVTLIAEQQEHVKDLNNQISIYQEDLHKLNEDNKKMLLIQSVDVKLLNSEKYKISQPDKTKFEEHIKDDISEVITKDIESVYKTKELLKRTIENKIYTINEKKYEAEVKELIIYTRLTVEIEISFASLNVEFF
ncbi:sporulation membrane protein YtrI [Bacillus atrophaeus]|nr:sporulation membrane protein YtrI [Bacillus atrophaeus]